MASFEILGRVSFNVTMLAQTNIICKEFSRNKETFEVKKSTAEAVHKGLPFWMQFLFREFSELVKGVKENASQEKT